MAFKPLRQKRMEYVESHRIEAGDEAHAHHERKGFDLGNFIEDRFYPKAEKRSDLPNYLVKLEEKDEQHKPWYLKQGKVTWLEKCTGRDFAIGSSTGALLGTAASLATAGAAAPVIGAMALFGGLAGGASDYVRNSEEIENGAVITPPSHFNRDAVKYSLGWALAAKFALTIATAILPMVSMALVVPEIVTGVCMVAGALYGAKKGADAGYERMDEDYKCATIKHQRPELSVSVQKEIVRGIDDLGLAAGVAVATGIAANQPQMAAQAVTSPQTDVETTKETTKWREQYQSRGNNMGSFVDRISQAPQQEVSLGSFG